MCPTSTAKQGFTLIELSIVLVIIGLIVGGGETGLLWVDLSTANGLNRNLVDGSFSTATSGVSVAVATAALPNYLPAAKLGRGDFAGDFVRRHYRAGYLGHRHDGAAGL